jgi:hypothetical protein
MMTLYEAFVPNCVQLLESLSGLLKKAEAHCIRESLEPEALIQAKLAPEMLGFAYQVKSCAIHSIGAIQGVQAGNFSPDKTAPPEDFEGLNAQITDAIGKLKLLSDADVEILSGKAMTFTIGKSLSWDFIGKDFLLSFSQPNFGFHVATAYGILRMKGVSIGKMDYLGAVRRMG